MYSTLIITFNQRAGTKLGSSNLQKLLNLNIIFKSSSTVEFSEDWMYLFYYYTNNIKTTNTIMKYYFVGNQKKVFKQQGLYLWHLVWCIVL